MTAFLKKHRKTKKIFSITLFKSISILLIEIIFTSIAKAVLRKNGVHYEISLHSSLNILANESIIYHTCYMYSYVTTKGMFFVVAVFEGIDVCSLIWFLCLTF